MKKLLIAVASVSLLAACASEEPAKTEAKPTEQPAAEAPAKPAPKKTVEGGMRAAFTSAVESREPVDTLSEIKKEEEGRITYFSEITGQNGTTVYHVWKNGDQEIYRHPFNIGSNKWRVYSNVSQWHYDAGDTVTVEIQDEEGNVLQSDSIMVK